MLYFVSPNPTILQSASNKPWSHYPSILCLNMFILRHATLTFLMTTRLATSSASQTIWASTAMSFCRWMLDRAFQRFRPRINSWAALGVTETPHWRLIVSYTIIWVQIDHSKKARWYVEGIFNLPQHIYPPRGVKVSADVMIDKTTTRRDQWSESTHHPHWLHYLLNGFDSQMCLSEGVLLGIKIAQCYIAFRKYFPEDSFLTMSRCVQHAKWVVWWRGMKDRL